MNGVRLRPPHRILLVETNDDGTTGGSYQCLFDLARLLDRTRFEPVALFYHENDFARRLRDLGIPVHVRESWARPGFPPVPIAGRLGAKVRAIVGRTRFLRREKIALVHLNNSPAAGCGDWLPAARLARIPCITHARAEVAPQRSRFQDYWMPRFDQVIAISRYIEAAMWRAGIPPARVTLVYDGIDADRFRAGIRRPPGEVRQSLGVPEGRLLVAMVGHLRTWKGQDLVLRALARLGAARRRLFVAFVGPAAAAAEAYRESLVRMVAELQLQDDVAFLGERGDVAEIMNASDVVLHASTIPEPFGLVVLEGLALGKPVVASMLGGPGEIITPGTGITFDPTDPEALPQVFLALVEQAGTGQALAAPAAVERAAAFSIGRNVAGVERVYSGLLDSLPQPEEHTV